MSNRETYTFALAKALYDDRQDLLTTLRPFFLKALREDRVQSVTEVKQLLLEQQAMDIPIHVIQRCGEAAEAASLVRVTRSTNRERQYTLTGDGSQQVLAAEAVSDVKRRVRHANSFLAGCMKQQGMDVDESEVNAALRRLIKRNLESAVGFVAGGGEDALDVKAESAIETALSHCVTQAAQSQPDVYATLRDLVYGSVVVATLSQGDDQVIESVSQPLGGLVVFADTNWLLGVLELDTPARNLAAAELLRLARSCGIEIRVLDFVLDECRALLRHYEQQYDSGELPADPSSVFVQMKLRGLTPGDVLLLRTYIVDRLQGHGVEVEKTGVDPRRFMPEDSALVDVLMHMKGETSPRRTKVDLAAIDQVQRRRGGQVADLESSKFAILSSDRTLARFNTQNMGHAAAGTYPEIVLDKILTTVVWLKNPGLDVPLEAVVAAHSRGLLHKQAVWFQVVRELARASADGYATPRDVSIFLSADGPDVIAEGVSRVEEVTPQVVRAVIAQARTAHESELENIMEVLAAESRKAIEEVRTTAEATVEEVRASAKRTVNEAAEDRSKTAERLSTLERREAKAREEIKEEAKTKAVIWALVTGLMVVVVLSGLLLLLRPWFEGNYGAADFTSVVVPIALVAIGVASGGSAIAHRVTIRNGERRANRLFGDS